MVWNIFFKRETDLQVGQAFLHQVGLENQASQAHPLSPRDPPGLRHPEIKKQFSIEMIYTETDWQVNLKQADLLSLGADHADGPGSTLENG